MSVEIKNLEGPISIIDSSKSDVRAEKAPERKMFIRPHIVTKASYETRRYSGQN